VNRKILLKALTLAVILLATPYVGMVSAGKGEEKLSIEFIVGSSVGEYDPGKIWYSPQNVESFLDARVVHYRDQGWGVDSTGFLITVDEGGPFEEILDDEDITYSLSYDLNLFAHDSPYLTATIHLRERWDLGERGYIETLAIEYLYNVLNLPMYEPYWGHGIFVGHGEIDGNKISISGEAGVALPGGPFRIGTVMGWPTP